MRFTRYFPHALAAIAGVALVLNGATAEPMEIAKSACAMRAASVLSIEPARVAIHSAASTQTTFRIAGDARPASGEVIAFTCSVDALGDSEGRVLSLVFGAPASAPRVSASPPSAPPPSAPPPSAPPPSAPAIVRGGMTGMAPIRETGNAGENARDRRHSGPVISAADIPRAVLDACLDLAGQYQGVKRNSAAVYGVTQRGSKWVLRIASPALKWTCTATAAGSVLEMNPKW